MLGATVNGTVKDFLFLEEIAGLRQGPLAELSRTVAVGSRKKDAAIMLEAAGQAAALELDAVQARCAALAFDFAKAAGLTASANAAYSMLESLSESVPALPIMPRNKGPLLTERERQIATLAGTGSPTRTSPWTWAFRSGQWRATCTRCSPSSAFLREVICLDSSKEPAAAPEQPGRRRPDRADGGPDIGSGGAPRRQPRGGDALGDSGLGKSRLMEAVVAELGAEVTPVRIHGSASLTKVPYGVLGPFIVGLPVQEATSQLAVLQDAVVAPGRRERATQKPLLLIVDDAHDLDEATAGILVELAAAGWAKLLVGSAARPGLPEPLLQLWFEGIAERHDLRPLTLGADHGACWRASSARRYCRASPRSSGKPPAATRCS